MSWFDPIDAYCERIDAAFWSEPVNAATNAAFVLAAGTALVLWRRRRAAHRRFDLAALSLIALVAVIGIGSFLFHTLANRWSLVADVLPIAIFIHGYLALALHRFGGLTPVAALCATAVFFAASFVAEPAVEPVLGSSAGYVPALLALFGIGGWLAATGRAGARAMLAAGVVFSASLALRTADAPVCERLPLGTHFLWHVLNAATLFVLLRAAIAHGPRRPIDA